MNNTHTDTLHIHTRKPWNTNTHTQKNYTKLRTLIKKMQKKLQPEWKMKTELRYIEMKINTETKKQYRYVRTYT